MLITTNICLLAAKLCVYNRVAAQEASTLSSSDSSIMENMLKIDCKVFIFVSRLNNKSVNTHNMKQQKILI